MTEESPKQTPVHDVFVSYASQDATIANSIVGTLEKNGVTCWIAPRDVTPGALYADGIIRAINEAKVLVLVLSASSIASKHVGKEVERASSKGRPIIALKVDATPLTTTLEYFLSESQWIDAAALGMPAALVKLGQAVGQVLASPSAVNPEAGAGGTSEQPTAVHPTGIGKRLALVAAAVVILGIAVSLAVRFWSTKGQAPAVAASSDKSIAVLPFADMSQKKDQEYFGEGMAEEILDLLAKIPGLTVIGRTSSFQFKGKNEDLRTIGAKLNAAYVLEGSVRSSGDQIRITAQLINTKTGAHEWSETYDRPIGDVLKLQDAIAAAVVRELQITVAPGYPNSRSLVKNAEGYDMYLRGRHSADRGDKEGLDEAVRLFQQALDRDPTSADVEAELAETYEVQGESTLVAPAVAFEKARREAAAALKLDPKNVRAHSVLGRIHVLYDWNWAAAEQEFEQAEKLAPSSADVLCGEAQLSLVLGHWDDALRQIKMSLAQDPLDSDCIGEQVSIHVGRDELPEAEAAIRRALNIRPDQSYGHFNLGYVLLKGGDRAGALHEMQLETIDNGKKEGLALVYYALGQRAEADAALAALLKDQANAEGIAEVYAFRGQSDEAMYWLERAYTQKESTLSSIKSDWLFGSLEPDPRFKAFLKKMNLPE
jgi:TolB-like protein/tetratricopeptide (TPR) repeat protein